MQRKLALKALLESAGYKILVEDLKTFYAYVDSKVINRHSKAIGLDSLSGLNYDLGEKSGLGKVLNILEGYKKELEEKSSS